MSSNSPTCPCCPIEQTLFANANGIQRRRRDARKDELERRVNQSNVVFSMASSKNIGRTNKHKRHAWCPDSGANVSVTNRLDIFETIEQYHPDVSVRVANKSAVRVALIGTVKLNLADANGKPYTLLLKNVHYSPDFSGNLLSVDEMHRQHKVQTVFGGSSHMLLPDGAKIPLQQDAGRSFQLHAYAMVSANAQLWHRRFMHVSAAALKRLSHVIAELSSVKDGDFSDCDACLSGGAPAGRQVGGSLMQ